MMDKIHGHCPTYVRALIGTASEGGSGGYHHVGAAVAPDLCNQRPWGQTPDEWGARLARLAGLVEMVDIPGVRAWFEAELPGIVANVPTRKRDRFAAGVVQVVHDRELDLTNL